MQRLSVASGDAGRSNSFPAGDRCVFRAKSGAPDLPADQAHRTNLIAQRIHTAALAVANAKPSRPTSCARRWILRHTCRRTGPFQPQLRQGPLEQCNLLGVPRPDSQESARICGLCEIRDAGQHHSRESYLGEKQTPTQHAEEAYEMTEFGTRVMESGRNDLVVCR
jgi:hypothetical protein